MKQQKEQMTLQRLLYNIIKIMMIFVIFNFYDNIIDNRKKKFEKRERMDRGDLQALIFELYGMKIIK